MEIADANASVSNISFPDEDLDPNAVGGRRVTKPTGCEAGTVSWNEPEHFVAPWRVEHERIRHDKTLYRLTRVCKSSRVPDYLYMYL